MLKRSLFCGIMYFALCFAPSSAGALGIPEGLHFAATAGSGASPLRLVQNFDGSSSWNTDNDNGESSSSSSTHHKHHNHHHHRRHPVVGESGDNSGDNATDASNSGN